MRANELMIGDWVLCDTNSESDYEFDNVDYQPYQIQSGEDIDYAIENNKLGDADVYQPLPLTTEILEKNGWRSRMNGTGEFYLIDLTIITKTITGFQMNHGHFNGLSIHYVHELQHALKLCGIDKTIEV